MIVMRTLRSFYQFVLSRRYKVEIVGLDLVTSEGNKLILPNHVSHIDPQIIQTWVYKYVWSVPVVSERFMKFPVVGYFMRKWEAVPVADFRRGNKDPDVMKNIYSGVTDALSKNRSVIIYPSGELASGGFERIKNKQAAHVVVTELPENAKVLGVRVKGLWGSMWSKAWDGTQPNFGICYLKGVGYWFANLIFLVPKRKVTLEFVDITKNAKLQALEGRKNFNDFLEEFYNEHGEEDPVYIKHFFFFPRPRKTLPENLPRYIKENQNLTNDKLDESE